MSRDDRSVPTTIGQAASELKALAGSIDISGPVGIRARNETTDDVFAKLGDLQPFSHDSAVRYEVAAS